MWRFPARLGAFLTCVNVLALTAAAPAAAAPGFTARFAELPDAFASGASPATVSVVVARSAGRDCLKVRWSMVLQVQELRIDQVRVERIEENGSFPVDIRADGATARVTDVQLDPGTLCRDRTVTARYAISFAEAVTKGQVSLAAEAYDANLRLLARETATRQVIGDPVPSSPAPTEPQPTDAPSDPGPSGPAGADPSAGAAGGDGGNPGGGAGTGQALDPAADNRDTGLPLIGFLIGAVLVFFGAGLLVRAGWRLRRSRATAPDLAGAVWSGSTARRRRTLRF